MATQKHFTAFCMNTTQIRTQLTSRMTRLPRSVQRPAIALPIRDLEQPLQHLLLLTRKFTE